jgi:hypothetical protein
MKARKPTRKKSGSAGRQERDVIARTLRGAMRGRFYDLINHGVYLGPEGSITVAESSALAAVQRHARGLVRRLRRNQPLGLELTSLRLPIPGESPESSAALLAAWEARDWVIRIAMHLQEPERRSRLRRCDCGDLFFATHRKTVYCPLCARRS